MNKLILSILGVLLLSLALGVFNFSRSKNDREPTFSPTYNLIFITVDALRADHTPFGAYSRQTMPASAEFFKDGIHFTEAVTVRSKTVPAYSSMLSGLYPYHHGVRRNYLQLPEDIDTLSEKLKRMGYTTAGFVSSFVMIGRFSGLNQGFDLYDDFVLEREITRDTYERTAGNTVKHVISWLDKVPRNRRFFLFLHFIDPHGPYHPPDPFKNSFDTAQKKILPKSDIPEEQYIDPIVDSYQYRDLYDGEILYLDTQLKSLYAKLHSFGQNSWILFTADHGETLDEVKPYFSHGKNCYEFETKIPMVWLPPVPLRSKFKASKIDQPVSLVDVVPTSLEALQIRDNEKFDGESLLPAFHGAHLKNPVRFIEHTEGSGQIFAAREARLKLIKNVTVALRRWPFRLFRRYESLSSTFELYDLSSDAREKANLIRSRKPQESLTEALDEFVFQAQNYRVPFEVIEIKAEREQRNEYIRDRKKNESIVLTEEDVEKLKALGYVNN